MNRYIMTFFGGNMSLRYDNLNTAEQETRETHKAAWSLWMANLAKSNKLEAGYPLESRGKRISPQGIEDYHFPDTTEGGFLIIKARSLDEAAEIAQSSPIIKNGGYILLRPCGNIN